MKLKDKHDGLINSLEYKRPAYKLLYAVMIFILIVASLAALIPIGWLFLAGFKDANEVFKAPFTFFPDSIDLGKIIEVWETVEFGTYFLNTLILMIGSVASAVVFNGLLAYAVSILKPAGYKTVYRLVMASYMIPAVASLVPLYSNIISLGFKGYAMYVPLCLLYGANAYYFMMFKNYFDTLPKAVIEASKIDGANAMQIFFKVVLPLSKPIIGVISIFAMTASWADFLLPYLLLQDESLYTAMVKIYNLEAEMSNMMNFGIDKYLMAISITVIPQLFIFAIFQKQITGTNATSGLKE
ncbi:MAG: carbohydrate ABC transporter permease [Eubacteriales bacterium]